MNNTLAEKLHKWSLEELNLVTDGSASRIPDINSFHSLVKGKNKKIWNYVVNHVRSQSTVRNIKRTLYIKKVLKDAEDCVSTSNDSSEDLDKLQSAVTRATEKRSFLMRKMSVIQERLLNLEQELQSTKGEILKINQKTTFLDLLNQQLTEKNSCIRNLHCEISELKNELVPCESVKECDKMSVVEPYDFLKNVGGDADENVSGIQDLLNLIAFFKRNFRKDYTDALVKHFFKNWNALKKSNIHLTDLVVLLKEISASDFQYLTTTNFQNLSSVEVMVNSNQQDSAKVLLDRLKCINVFNSVGARKNKKQTEELLIIKEKMFEDKFTDAKLEPSDFDFNLKRTLIEKMAENEALIMSNNYMDNYVKHLSNKTDLILGNLHKQKLCSVQFTSVSQKFFDNSDLTYYLMYSAADTFQKVFEDLNSLHLFAHKDMFKPLPGKECLDKLKSSLISDRIQSLNYSDKSNTTKSLFSNSSSNDYLLSHNILKSLKLEPFQNISFLCENWINIKQKLHTEAVAYSEKFVENKSVDVSEMYSNFLTMLEKMKFSVEKGLSIVNEGMILCDETKSEIQECWEQNAQFIPHIEYEGKTLKMWIDILSVLSDFEFQNDLQK